MGGYGGEAGVPLLGGDVSDGVVKVGETVRKPRSASSRTVRSVLQHLEAVGFDGAPRWLGEDALGRDVLSYLPGEVAGRPWPSWVGDAERAVSVARLVRRLDDAMLPLGVPEWATADRLLLPPRFVGHFDVTPENVVFSGGAATAIIDFDLARPGTAVEEVSNLLLWWAGWMAPEDREPALQDVDPCARGRLLLDAYGLDAASRRSIAPLAVEVARRAWHTMRWRSEHLGGGWQRMWDAGVGDRIRRREAWLLEHQEELAAAAGE